MIGNFNRDRSPFVLTPDMAFVINGCEKKPSEKFHEFVDLCCKGIYFNLIEKCNAITFILVTLRYILINYSFRFQLDPKKWEFVIKPLCFDGFIWNSRS